MPQTIMISKDLYVEAYYQAKQKCLLGDNVEDMPMDEDTGLILLPYNLDKIIEDIKIIRKIMCQWIKMKRSY